MIDVRTTCPQEMCCNDKGFEICTIDLEFESGRASLVRAGVLLVYLGPQSVLSRGWGFLKLKKKRCTNNKLCTSNNLMAFIRIFWRFLR